MSSFVQKVEVAALESFDSDAYCPGDMLKTCVKEVEEKAPFRAPVRLEIHLQSRTSLDGNEEWQMANATDVPECIKASAGDMLKKCIKEAEEMDPFCEPVRLKIDLQGRAGLDGNSKQQKANATEAPECLPSKYIREDGSECNRIPDDVSECSTVDMPSESRIPSDTIPEDVSECSTVDIPAESGIPSDFDTEEAQKPVHPLVKCRPCGFFHHKGGCDKGLECNFCHLCPPGSIERERKDKRQSNKALKRQQARANAIQVDAAVAFYEASARRAFMAAASANAAAVTLRSYMEAY